MGVFNGNEMWVKLAAYGFGSIFKFVLSLSFLNDYFLSYYITAGKSFPQYADFFLRELPIRSEHVCFFWFFFENPFDVPLDM